MASMLSLRQPELAEALEEVGQYGVCKIAGALTPDARHELRMALEALDFQGTPQWVGEVRQDFDLLAIKPGLGRADTALAPLLALAESYAALLRSRALSLDEPSLADFVPTDLHVQRYSLGSAGISPHRDSRPFIKLISIFSLGSPAEFRLFRDRRGPPLRRYQLSSGDLLLLRAPGFAHRPSAGPLHSVSGPTDDVRYSITLRMKQPAAATTAS
jgi:hypothetical protein